MLPSPARHRQPLRLLSHVFPFLGKSDSYGEASRRSGEGAQRTVCLYNLLGLYEKSRWVPHSVLWGGKRAARRAATISVWPTKQVLMPFMT
jgi:hypothetical protein